MRVLMAGLNYQHHINTCAVLKTALENRKHTVDWELFSFDIPGPYVLQDFLEELTDLMPKQLEVLGKKLSSGVYDLLISEIVIYAAAELHEKSGIPWAVYSNLPIFWVSKHIPLFLQCTIPSFEVAIQQKNLQFIGPISAEALEMPPPPEWLNSLSREKRIIHVTQGTVTDNSVDLILPTMAACGKSYHCITEPFSHAHFLKHVDLFITNGGYGGVSCAILAGIPIITAGDTEDKAIIGRHVVRAGNGIDLATRTPTVRQIKEAIEEIFINPSYKTRALELQKECLGYSIEQGVDSLEILAGLKGKTPSDMAKEQENDSKSPNISSSPPMRSEALGLSS